MTLLNRDDWYDISHDLDWTLSYVKEQDAFPMEWSGTVGIPKEAWQSWEEPFRVSYRDYVMVQREKEAGVAGVRDALKRARIYEKLDPAFAAVSHSTWAHCAWSSRWRSRCLDISRGLLPVRAGATSQCSACLTKFAMRSSTCCFPMIC